MIRSFGDRRTEDLFHGRTTNATVRMAPALRRAAGRKLDVLHAATSLPDLHAVPGHRLEALRGNLHGWHSIRVNRQWRIVFRHQPNGLYDVTLMDYH